jgi:hypothetical protein
MPERRDDAAPVRSSTATARHFVPSGVLLQAAVVAALLPYTIGRVSCRCLPADAR